MCRSRDRRVERTAARFIAIRSAVPELTRSAPIQLNKRFSLRRCAVTISLADDERSPLEFYLFGSLGCRGDVLALVHVCLCRACFQALKRAQSDDSQPLYAAAADSNHPLVAVDRGFFLRRYCSGRRPGSHWLDCTGTAGILGPATSSSLPSPYPAPDWSPAHNAWIVREHAFQRDINPPAILGNAVAAADFAASSDD